MDTSRCPLTTTDCSMVRQFLMTLPEHDLNFYTEQIFSRLSPSEKSGYPLDRFCSDYSDSHGRIEFIEALIDARVIAPVHVPYSARRDSHLLNLIRPPAYSYYLPVAQENKEGEAALTDDIIVTPKDDLKVGEPHWQHTNNDKKEASSTTAAVGDEVELNVKVSGYPDGAPVTFDIYDAGSEPPLRITTLTGSNSHTAEETDANGNKVGHATAVWSVEDPNGRGKELKLEVECSARSKCSGRAPLIIQTVYEVSVLDDEGNPLEGVVVTYVLPGKKECVTTDKNGTARYPVEDSSVNAEIQLQWEEKKSGDDVATSQEAATSEEDVEVVPPVPVAGTDSAVDGYEVFVGDSAETRLEGVKVCFGIGDTKTVVATDADGRAFLPSDKGASVGSATVTILWEDGSSKVA